MAYQPPGVEVTQVFNTAAPTAAAPDLFACVVGPPYQVVKKASAGEYDGTETVCSYPGLYTDAVITTADVLAYVKLSDLTYVDVTDDCTINGSSVTYPAVLKETIQAQSTTGVKSGHTLTDVNALFVTNVVRPGYFVKVGSNYYEVSDVVGETELTLLITPSESNDLTYTVIRKLTGTAAITFVALRQDEAVLDQLIEVSSFDDLINTFGEDALGDPKSVVAFAAQQCFGASGSTIFVYCTDGNVSESTAHGRAMDALSTKRVYHIAPITYTTGVLSSWITHVDNMSTASARGWRRLYISQALVRSETITTGTNGATNGGGTTLTSSAHTFQTLGVKAGDILILTEQTDDPEYVIKSVDSETVLTLESAATGSLTSQDYTVRRDYTRTQQADNLRSIGLSTANMRVTRIVPDEFYVTVDGDSTKVAGYYGAAARAGLASSFAIGKPQTNATVPGFDSITHSNDWFSENQLNVIASGGMEVFVQPTSGASIAIRDDLTTDMSSFNKENISMVISRDWLSYVAYDVLAPQVASNNITDRFINILKTAVGAVVSKAMSLPDQAFISITVTKVEKNADNPGHVTIELQITQGEPGKYIDVSLVV